MCDGTEVRSLNDLALSASERSGLDAVLTAAGHEQAISHVAIDRTGTRRRTGLRAGPGPPATFPQRASCGVRLALGRVLSAEGPFSELDQPVRIFHYAGHDGTAQCPHRQRSGALSGDGSTSAPRHAAERAQGVGRRPRSAVLLGALLIGGAATGALLKRRAPSAPPLDVPRAEGVSSGDEVDPRARPRWVRITTGSIVVVIAVLAIGGGLLLWPSAVASPSPPDVSGGILLLQNADLPLEANPQVYTADIDTTLQSTGMDGVSLLRLTITFLKPTPHVGDVPVLASWYLVTSGDYVAVADAPDNFYCSGETLMKRSEDHIACGTIEGPEVQFFFDSELAFASPDGAYESVVDLAGYEPGRSSVITGSIVDGGAEGTTITLELPVRTPREEPVGASTFLNFPPIGLVDNEWGGGPRVIANCNSKPQLTPDFFLPSTCAALNFIKVQSVAFDVDRSLNAETIAFAAPDTLTDEHLGWEVDGGFAGGQALVTDPFVAQSEVQHSFLAGILISLGVSLIVVLVERIAFRERS